MIKTGSIELDNFLYGYNNEITYIYGTPGSGKTTLCKLAAINLLRQNKKVIYIDTENGFSLERFKQLSPDFEKILDNLIVIKIKSLNDQTEKLETIKDIKNISLIIVDSVGRYYRTKIRNAPKETNEILAKYLGSLRLMTKNNTPVIITNQVYDDIKTNKIVPVGGEMIKKFCKKIIELKTEPRKLIQTKPFELQLNFEIVNEGIKIINH